MAKFLRQETNKIRFDDGRRGRQAVNVYDDGSRELHEVVVTAEADGTRCRHVYARRSDIAAHVYSLGDLAQARWVIAE